MEIQNHGLQLGSRFANMGLAIAKGTKLRRVSACRQPLVLRENNGSNRFAGDI